MSEGLSRKESVAKLFRHHAREATPERLNSMLEDTMHVSLQDLRDVCEQLSREWEGKKAPIPGDVNALARKLVDDREEQERIRAKMEEAKLPHPDEVAGGCAGALDYVQACRETWEDGIFVPPNRFVGRVLATMYVHHVRKLGWRDEPSDDDKAHYEAALSLHQQQHDGADVNWWREWKRDQQWL